MILPGVGSRYFKRRAFIFEDWEARLLRERSSFRRKFHATPKTRCPCCLVKTFGVIVCSFGPAANGISLSWTDWADG
jgi:hypothetical protein